MLMHFHVQYIGNSLEHDSPQTSRQPWIMGALTVVTVKALLLICIIVANETLLRYSMHAIDDFINNSLVLSPPIPCHARPYYNVEEAGSRSRSCPDA
jgi:hypothetical protein